MIGKVRNFFSEVGAEMQKDSWPTREELVGSTSVVLFTMFFLSVFIGLADFILSLVLKILLR